MRTCASLIGGAVLLVALLVVGWLKRDEIVDFVSSHIGSRDEPVMAAAGRTDLARSAEGKIIALGGGEVEEVILSGDELDGLVRHRLEGFFPDYVHDISTAIDSSSSLLVLSGRVIAKRVPGSEQIGPMIALLGDTADVRVRGRVDGLEPGRGIFHVEAIQVGPLPLPPRARDELVRGLKRAGGAETPANAVAFDLPRFVTDIGVRGGRLHLRGCGAGVC